MSWKDIPKNHKPSDHKDAEGGEQSTNRHVFVEPGVKLDFTDGLKKQHETERTQDQTTQKKQLRWTMATAGLVAIYTLVMVWQGILTRDSLKATREFFERDQRPYVFSSKVGGAQFGGPNNWLVTMVWYQNYGKSPALRVTEKSEILHGNSGRDILKKADEWFRGLDGQPNRPDRQESILIQGDTPTGQPVSSLTSAAGPNVPYAVVMQIVYFDMFGNRYWSDVCFWSLTPDMVGTRCPKHNEIH